MAPKKGSPKKKAETVAENANNAANSAGDNNVEAKSPAKKGRGKAADKKPAAPSTRSLRPRVEKKDEPEPQKAEPKKAAPKAAKAPAKSKKAETAKKAPAAKKGTKTKAAEVSPDEPKVKKTKGRPKKGEDKAESQEKEQALDSTSDGETAEVNGD